MNPNIRRIYLRTLRKISGGYKTTTTVATASVNIDPDAFTLAGAATLGVTAIVAVAGIHMISTLSNTGSRPQLIATASAQASPAAIALANSEAFAEREELCVFRQKGNAGTVYFDCSPHYDKGRAPGGKLISGRLPVAGAVAIPNVTVIRTLPPNWGHPGETTPTPTPKEWYNISLPERAPLNIRLLKSELQADERETRAAASLKKKSSGSNSNSSSKRCKARSYWNGKECRLRR